jgi:hypothetical protein
MLRDGPFVAVETILTQFGYGFVQLRQEAPVPCEKNVPGKKEQYRNYLCTVRDVGKSFP